MGLDYLGLNPDQFPEFRKKFHGELLICGSGRCAWDDLQKINWTNYDVMCVNDMIMHFPGKVTHVYSNDHHMLPNWVAARRPQYKKEESIIVHTCHVGSSTMKIWPFPGHGSSSLSACYVGLALGYDSITLAGIPLDDSGHYFDPPWVKTNFLCEVPERILNEKPYPRYWESAARNVFDGKVRSLSGRTKELLDDFSA
jgi:hypothetical protein